MTNFVYDRDTYLPLARSICNLTLFQKPTHDLMSPLATFRPPAYPALLAFVAYSPPFVIHFFAFALHITLFFAAVFLFFYFLEHFGNRGMAIGSFLGWLVATNFGAWLSLVVGPDWLISIAIPPIILAWQLALKNESSRLLITLGLAISVIIVLKPVGLFLLPAVIGLTSVRLFSRKSLLTTFLLCILSLPTAWCLINIHRLGGFTLSPIGGLGVYAVGSLLSPLPPSLPPGIAINHARFYEQLSRTTSTLDANTFHHLVSIEDSTAFVVAMKNISLVIKEGINYGLSPFEVNQFSANLGRYLIINNLHKYLHYVSLGIKSMIIPFLLILCLLISAMYLCLSNDSNSKFMSSYVSVLSYSALYASTCVLLQIPTGRYDISIIITILPFLGLSFSEILLKLTSATTR